MTKYSNTSKAKDITIYKVDMPENNEIAKKYEVNAVPYLLYFKDGKVLGRELGIKSPEKLKELENKYFKN